MAETKYIPYFTKLKDPRWQKKRLEVLQKNYFACSVCESTTKTLNVHHPVYLKNKEPWEYKADVLMCLCDDCHKEAHEAEALIDYYANLIKTGGFIHPRANDREVWPDIGMLAGIATPMCDDIYIHNSQFAFGLAKYLNKTEEEILDATIDGWLPYGARLQWQINKFNKKNMEKGRELFPDRYDLQKKQYL